MYNWATKAGTKTPLGNKPSPRPGMSQVFLLKFAKFSAQAPSRRCLLLAFCWDYLEKVDHWAFYFTFLKVCKGYISLNHSWDNVGTHLITKTLLNTCKILLKNPCAMNGSCEMSQRTVHSYECWISLPYSMVCCSHFCSGTLVGRQQLMHNYLGITHSWQGPDHLSA